MLSLGGALTKSHRLGMFRLGPPHRRKTHVFAFQPPCAKFCIVALHFLFLLPILAFFRLSYAQLWNLEADPIRVTLQLLDLCQRISLYLSVYQLVIELNADLDHKGRQLVSKHFKTRSIHSIDSCVYIAILFS
jgi:hypothetical protein